jgi:uncharacterized protein
VFHSAIARSFVLAALAEVYLHEPMLELRPNCELCDRDLPPESAEARICSYECTFCAHCVEDVLHDICPNCGGGFRPRPIRPPAALERDPASTQRVVRKG